MATTQQLVLEHQFRDAIREQIKRFDDYTNATTQSHLSVTVEYDHGRSDGVWKLYTYYKGISLNTQGAVLADTMSRHLNQLREQDGSTYLPSLIAGPSASVPMSEDI